MAENVTQRKEEDKKKEQKSTNYGAEFVVAKIKANCWHNKAGFCSNALWVTPTCSCDRKVPDRE